ncbi:hypothetical protein Ahy_B09g099507 isoform C [Arachis hypogaea]|uniref:Uncharacterized protein n=1 Tax=Arachis hypogaea TaxID=3818 RepID=A0A444XTX8_ARAHY|nr:hypothetical protein Ahy_B09g099507 isoform C [Arachis hypogaea]
MDAVGDDVNVDELGNIDWEEDNNNSEEEFEANYEVDDENDNGDLAGNPASEPLWHSVFYADSGSRSHHAPEFSEYANIVTTTINFICLVQLTVVRMSQMKATLRRKIVKC